MKMSRKANLPHSLSPRRKTKKTQKSVGRSRVLPNKVIDKKTQGNSSSFISNGHLNKVSSAKSKSKASSPLMTDENMSSDHSDSEEDIGIDYLLIGNEKTDKGEPSKNVAAKQEFKTSRVPNEGCNVKKKASGKSKILNKNLKAKHRKENLSLKTKPIENYFNASSQGKSLQQDSPEIPKDRTFVANSQRKKSSDRSTSQNNIASVCNNALSMLPAVNTGSSSDVSRNKSVEINPQQRSNASSSNDKHTTSRNVNAHSSVSVPHKIKCNKNEILNTLEWEGPRRFSGRLRNKKVSSDIASNVGKKKTNSSASSPSHIPQAPLPSSEQMDNKNHRKKQPSKPIKKQPKKPSKNKQDVLSQMPDDSIVKSGSRSQNLHSTALNVNTQTLELSDSSIEPIESSPMMRNQLVQPQHDIVDVPRRRTQISNLDEPSPSNSGEQDQQLMELDGTLTDIPRVPDDITRHILRYYSDIPISNSAMSVLNKCCDDFWRQTLDTLHTYTQHGQRQIPTVADVELLLYRQGYMYDRNSLNSLVEEHLPVELVSEIIAEPAAEILESS